MNNGDIKLAEKIRSDILKANKEISKLDKWEKVDNWFYYLAVPTMFIPIISNVVTVGGAYSRYHIESKQKKIRLDRNWGIVRQTIKISNSHSKQRKIKLEFFFV